MVKVVVMGVAGSGKTTVGRLLADALGVPFVDGDDLHSPANIAKMASGAPLTDADRWPWLAAVGAWLVAHPGGGVVACSALKRSYRDAIRGDAPEARFVHLVADPAILAERLAERQAADGHFMGVGMLASQLADLEPLGTGERGIEVDVGTGLADEAVKLAVEAALAP